MYRAYCFGHISTGILYRIRGVYPDANGYGEIISQARNFCGEALSSAVVLRRLGVDVSLEGNWLGDSKSGQQTRAFICGEGIDDTPIMTPPGYAGIEEIMICDNTSRTVFGRYEALLFTTRQWEMPTVSRVQQAHVACADPSFGEATVQVALAAKEKKIPFVAIDTAFDNPLASHAAVVIVSQDFLLRTYGASDFHEIFNNYLQHCAGLSIFTFGESDLWFGRTHKKTMSPSKVTDAVDTAGAGDSFRAGIMYGLLHGMTDLEMIRFACDIAAEVVRSTPGVIGFRAKNHQF
jgi:sugar/nucleoside kinase (ribokinase family)